MGEATRPWESGEKVVSFGPRWAYGQGRPSGPRRVGRATGQGGSSSPVGPGGPCHESFQGNYSSSLVINNSKNTYPHADQIRLKLKPTDEDNTNELIGDVQVDLVLTRPSVKLKIEHDIFSWRKPLFATHPYSLFQRSSLRTREQNLKRLADEHPPRKRRIRRPKEQKLTPPNGDTNSIRLFLDFGAKADSSNSIKTLM
ncbi:hypothetical protein ACLOJK_023573 [Asimina triloba]